jgi:hypothetical protein
MRTTSLTSLAKIVAIAVAGSLASPNVANGAENLWDKDWIALTVGNDGAWGLGTNLSRSKAIAAAIADCRHRATNVGSGCGARTNTVRGGWTLAFACGATNFIVSAETFAEARTAAIYREIELREIRRLDFPVCDLVVGIGSTGRPATLDELNELAAFRITR